jgi:hypothetical protein
MSNRFLTLDNGAFTSTPFSHFTRQGQGLFPRSALLNNSKMQQDLPVFLQQQAAALFGVAAVLCTRRNTIYRSKAPRVRRGSKS